MEWIKIAEKIPQEDKLISLKVLNKQICIVNHEGKLFAFSAKCPHAGGNMGNGWYEDGYVVCPVHRYKYNLENGRGAIGQGDYLKIYQIEQRSDGVYILLKRNWFSIFKW